MANHKLLDAATCYMVICKASIGNRIMSGCMEIEMKAFTAIYIGILLCGEVALAGDTNLPKTLAELNRWYLTPPAEQNAATVYLDACATINITDGDASSSLLPLIGESRLPDPDLPVPSEMKLTIDEFVRRNQEAFSTFDRATKLVQSRYPIDLKEGYAVQLRHLPEVKQGCQVLALFTVSQALRCQGEEVGNGFLNGLALACSLEVEPVLISQLVRVAGVLIMVNCLEWTLNQVTLPPETLKKLQKVLDQREANEASGEAFHRAFVAERLVGLSHFNRIAQELDWNKLDMPRDEIDELMTRELDIRKNIQADQAHFELTLDRALAARSNGFPSRLKMSEAFERGAVEADKHDLFISTQLLQPLTSIAPKEGVCLAQLRLAQTAVALELFREAHERYPESLNEATPNYLSTIPQDPFDAKPLRYRRTPDGYLLYSIGTDLKDDAGLRTRKAYGQGDLVFNVVRSSKSSKSKR